MTEKCVGVFDARQVYDELAIYIGYPGRMPTTMQRVAIAYLIDKECCVEFSDSVLSWYRPLAGRMQFHNLDRARHVFHNCFDYFLFGAMNFENIHLQFSGHTVFVSNFDYDLRRLNK